LKIRQLAVEKEELLMLSNKKAMLIAKLRVKTNKIRSRYLIAC